MICRHCGSRLEQTFLDLGFAPPSNSYLSTEDLNAPELFFPLRLKFCEECWLVQTEDYPERERLFCKDYAYFSSTSKDWLDHAARYVERVVDQLNLGAGSHVIEVASNDGYLLKNFVKKGIACLGIEPTEMTANAAEAQGIPVIRKFFGRDLAEELASDGLVADLVIGNNVLAHVPEINDFSVGIKKVLKKGGTFTFEFPHLLKLVEECQFDTVYHEHFSYLSLFVVDRILSATGLRIFDVEMLPTHGGSLRIWGGHSDDERPNLPSVDALLETERHAGLLDGRAYSGFQPRVNRIKDELVAFLIEQKRARKKVAAYGAAAKGNTLLNYAGIRQDLLPFVCDAAPSKQGKFLPGSHIPIFSPDMLVSYNPDYLLLLPWNLEEELRRVNGHLLDRGTRIVTAIPSLRVDPL
ncbi:MAG: class I SAM-dependent methyltransferase [Telmatospirillum sp.]|nr:class I SAM-dependent methyltransferase [Telmatospirillum sp.]